MQGITCGIKRNAVHDGDGLRTTVFFKGCPLKCVWCHNPESLSFRPQVGFYGEKCMGCGSCVFACTNAAIRMEHGRSVTDPARCSGCGKCTEYCPTGARIAYGEAWEVEPLVEKLLQDKPFFDNSGGGVTLSGGECLAQPDFAVALAQALCRRGVRVNIDTCGYVRQEIVERILPYTHTFLYDIKAISPQVHLRCTGKDNERILKNLRYIGEKGGRIEIRYPYVPGYNDDQCDAIGTFLAQIPGIVKVKVLGYHGFADGKYAALSMENTLPDVKVTAADVQQAVDILRGYGLRVVNGMEDDEKNRQVPLKGTCLRLYSQENVQSGSNG